MHPTFFASLLLVLGFHLDCSILGSILKPNYARVLGTVGATENHIALFHTVADHPAAAVFTGRRQRVDGTFKRIKNMFLTVQRDRERLVVFIAANFAFHGRPSFV